MIKHDKKVIYIIIGVIIVIIVAFAVKTQVIKNKDEKISQRVEYVIEKENGQRENVSPRLKEVKQIEGMEISNMQITSKDNETIIEGRVKNTSNKKNGDYGIKLILKDKQGETIKEVKGYIGSVEKGKTTRLRIRTTLDYVEAYDYSVEKDKI